LFQPENAFHIKNFFDDKTDRELYELSSFLEFLANVEDVRPVENWRKKYSAQSASISHDKSQRRTKGRQESTDSNAPMQSKSFMMGDNKKRSNFDGDIGDLDDIDLKNFENTKTVRYNREAEIPPIIYKQS